MKTRHILFAFATILLIGCSESDESISARVAKTRADEAIALFKQDIAELEIQVEKLAKENARLVQANNKKNERLIQANKKLRQENMTLAKQLEDMKKSYLVRRDVPKKIVASRKSIKLPKKKHGDKVGAWTMAQLIVEQFARSPSTVSYGGWLEQTADNCVKQYANGEYVVTGFFDSQNAFGAAIRTYFTLELQCTDNETYKLIGVPTFSQR